MGFRIFSFSFLFAWCCVVAEAILFSYFGTTAFPFHISRVVGLGDSFIIMSAKLVSWFFEVCPLGNGSFDVFHVVGRGSLCIVCLASCVPIYEIVGVFSFTNLALNCFEMVLLAC